MFLMTVPSLLYRYYFSGDINAFRWLDMRGKRREEHDSGVLVRDSRKGLKPGFTAVLCGGEFNDPATPQFPHELSPLVVCNRGGIPA